MTYTYNEVGQRTKSTPTSGSATVYGYDQAGNLTSVEKGSLSDTYAYGGNNLRASQTISGTMTYMAWDVAEEVPLLLSDGTNSYIYGPENVPVEQINGAGTPLYLHHDQQGSTRLLTSSTGTKEATVTYDAYGNTTGTTGTATTPLGYDGQYTSSDTGLIYLRARTYDPKTTQFLSVDPLEQLTRAPYSYVQDNPANEIDPTGLASQACIGLAVDLGVVSLGIDGCYVTTPGGEGITVSPSAGLGIGLGANVHYGAGESNICHVSEYGGGFSQIGASASAGFVGGYYNEFSNWPLSSFTGARPVHGWTAGGAAGLNADVGAGGSYTFVFPLNESSGSGTGGCGC